MDGLRQAGEQAGRGGWGKGRGVKGEGGECGVGERGGEEARNPPQAKLFVLALQCSPSAPPLGDSKLEHSARSVPHWESQARGLQRSAAPTFAVSCSEAPQQPPHAGPQAATRTRACSLQPAACRDVPCRAHLGRVLPASQLPEDRPPLPVHAVVSAGHRLLGSKLLWVLELPGGGVGGEGGWGGRE